jgi:hypothetical protein
MAKEIGIGLTSRLSRTKASMVHGYTPTCIAKKAIMLTQAIGTVGRGSLFAGAAGCGMAQHSENYGRSV